MTRVVFWNIDQFRLDLFASSGAEPDKKFPTLTQAETAAGRRLVILDTLAAANPDIVVIVEVIGRKNKSGRIAPQSGGLLGAEALLNELRGFTEPPDTSRPTLTSPTWRLVPPYWLQGTGNSTIESVAIFYRGETGADATLVKRYFTGPQLWSGGPNGVPVAVGAGTAYSPTVNRMLVPPGTVARTIPKNAGHNAEKKENVVAARFEYLQKGTAAPKDFGVARPPFLATFTEQAADGALRDLSVFGVHAPADDEKAEQFIKDLADTEQVTAVPGARETRLVGGDFNINLLDSTGKAAPVYNSLKDESYVPLLTPAGEPPPDLTVYRGYFVTHLFTLTSVLNDTELQNSKFLWSASDTDPSPYPGYGYYNADLKPFSIDNVLVRPHRPDPHKYLTTVLNYVVGTPLNKITDPPGSPPVGSMPLDSGITVGGWPPFPNAPVFDLAVAQQLIGWSQYGRLRSTSDHFAFFAEV